MSGVRGKFRLSEITHLEYNETAKRLLFNAVCNDSTEENAKFHKYTPSGTISMVVDNPEAMKQFELRKEYYVDFSPVAPQA